MVSWATGCMGNSLIGDLYLHTRSHHHPHQKCAMLCTLVYRAWTIVNQANLLAEMDYVKKMFQANDIPKTRSTECSGSRGREQLRDHRENPSISFLSQETPQPDQQVTHKIQHKHGLLPTKESQKFSATCE